MSLTNLPLIMLIDDSDIDLFLNNKMLLVSGITDTDNIIPCSSANEALEYLKNNENAPGMLPSIILLDILMPETNGFQFLEKFAELPDKTKEGTNIIMLSSTLDPKDIDRARDNQYVVDILKKPLNTEALKEVLGQLDLKKAV